ncbi:MAG TPA: DUF167 domain-containing protein [Elusimicrobiales bacterium]|nr:DUF167 domain-containing protein [Elusimicrobiales bacterium]
MTKLEFIKLKVFANSKKNCIIQISRDTFKVYVKQKAVGGAANKKALELLADALQIEAKKLKIIKGAQRPNKIVKIL